MSIEDKKPDNPQAYPYVLSADPLKGWDAEAVPGITLRDHYAGQALVGLMSSYVGSYDMFKAINNEPESIAKAVWKMADAMLKER